ncbi:MAG: ABC transporter permease [Proteobacteria bacterium]|nr:ABC transporter permease [Desulfobulbaceae bacterium]MBU4152628.1 ABC transporter permease [Pseudomonadota bacterium]
MTKNHSTSPRHDQTSWDLTIHRDTNNDLEIAISGCWRLDQHLPSLAILKDEMDTGCSHLHFNTQGLTDWDSGLLTFLAGLAKEAKRQGMAVDNNGLPPGVQKLLALALAVPEHKATGRDAGKPGLLAQLGDATLNFAQSVPTMLHFLGEIVIAFIRLCLGRSRFRLSDLWLEVEEVGPRALPIVSVISGLVGLILAYLGADQLRMVGAQIFIADLVAIGMVREVGALMTGIIIAGRTGAAFAAQLGTMQVNEEIDAFKTMGISPIDFLVLPRMIALMLMVPLLTLYAAFVGMLAGLMVSITIFDIGFFEYYTETLRALELKHFFVGLSKGSVYGAMVAYAGCLRGIHCGRSAEAVGSAATSAVVTGILLITIMATIMTIVYYQLGI